jgi:hypothetical protein
LSPRKPQDLHPFILYLFSPSPLATSSSRNSYILEPHAARESSCGTSALDIYFYAISGEKKWVLQTIRTYRIEKLFGKRLGIQDLPSFSTAITSLILCSALHVIYCMCVRASYMKMTTGTNLMQQFYLLPYITLHVSGIYIQRTT